MNQGPGSQSSTQIVTCEKHGLRYNAAIQWGCARCRREAGERPQRRPSPATGPIAAGRRASGGGALVAALAVAVVLILVASGGLYLVHGVIHEAAQGGRPFTGAGSSVKGPSVEEDLEALQKALADISDEPEEESGEEGALEFQ